MSMKVLPKMEVKGCVCMHACLCACVRVIFYFQIKPKVGRRRAEDASLQVLFSEQQLQLETEEVQRDRRSRQSPQPCKHDVNTGISRQLKLLCVYIRAQFQ